MAIPLTCFGWLQWWARCPFHLQNADGIHVSHCPAEAAESHQERHSQRNTWVSTDGAVTVYCKRVSCYAENRPDIWNYCTYCVWAPAWLCHSLLCRADRMREIKISECISKFWNTLPGPLYLRYFLIQTWMNCTIPSGTEVLLSFCRYSTMSEVCSPTLTAA